MKEPTIVEVGPILLLGFSFYGDPFQLSAAWTEENEIGRLWQRFMAFLQKEGQHIQHLARRDVTYEVHVYDEETMEKGTWEVFVGVEVEKLEEVPVELVAKILPSTTYALFTFQGEQIGGDWSATIYNGWLPGSGYEQAYTYAFQRYDHRFKGVDNLAESELDVFIPIKRQPTTDK